MYPPGFATAVSVEGLGDRLEGKIRPGHFRGVATVVLKLLDIVSPRWAYFGRKDAQQARIIEVMARDLALDAEIVVRPIVRETDGLALSSRNAYLSSSERAGATALHASLDAMHQAIQGGERIARPLLDVARRVLGAEPLARVDYVELVDAGTFEPVGQLRGRCYALLAVRFGTTRLIDNMLIEVAEGGGSACCEL